MGLSSELECCSNERCSRLIDEFYILVPEPFPRGGIKVWLFQNHRGFHIKANLYFTDELSEQYPCASFGGDAGELLAEFLTEMHRLISQVSADRVRDSAVYLPDP